MSLTWGKPQSLPDGWFVVTEPDRFSVTFTRSAGRYVVGEIVRDGKYTNTVVRGGFDTAAEAKAEAERLAKVSA